MSRRLAEYAPASASRRLPTALLALLLLAVTATAADLRVRLRGGSGATIQSLSLERYTTAAVAGEGSVIESPAALQALAVAARTWAVRMRGRHAAEGYDLCDTTHCQRLESLPAGARVQAAVESTTGQLLWDQGKPAFTPYTRDCGGRTEEAAVVWPDLAAPYLRTRDDPWCTRAGGAPWTWSVAARELGDVLRRNGLRAPADLERVSIVERSSSGRALVLALAGAGGSERIAAGSFRFAIGRDLGWNTLRSDRYTVHSGGGRIAFAGSGAGHGVGLCQRGAAQLGAAGRSWRDILAFYYPGTTAGLTARGIAWQTLAGDRITLQTADPHRDRLLLPLAERLLGTAQRRSGWAAPSPIEIRVYPDLDGFRNATGEPGWVAARTDGRRIHLQPVTELQRRGTLKRTLAHELWHVLIDGQAAPDLAVWFREGLAEYLSGARPGAASGTPRDEPGLRQGNDRERARRAYAEAAAAVAALVRRRGEATVLDWVRRGLPPEVAREKAER